MRKGAESLATVERAIIAQALQATGGNLSATAKLVGVHRKSLARKVQKFGLTPAREGLAKTVATPSGIERRSRNST